MADDTQSAESGSILPTVRTVEYDAAARWLGEGWGDLRQVPLASMTYGACFFTASWLMAAVFADAYALFTGLLMGFMLLGPVLAMGTYELSRRIGLGQKPRFIETMTAWRPNLANIGVMVAVLGVLFLVWARASMVVFALFFDTAGLPNFGDVLRATFGFNQPIFALVYFASGSIFAALAFAISAIALPMMLDRKVDAVSAALVSIAACRQNPLAMLIWAGCIVSLIVGSYATNFFGLVVIMPWLGHATWHAYRDITGTGPSSVQTD